MENQLIFVPVLAHIGLVFGIYLLLLKRKLRAASTGEVDLKATALNCKAWPDNAVLKASNNLDNQFEAPVLFYALCFVLYAVDGVNTGSLILAWLFVFSRYLHAYIHTGRNYVPHRMRVFAVGIGSLVALLGVAAFKLCCSSI
jgi:hypothetical protein